MFKKLKEKESNVLYNFKRTRKAFLPEYACAAFIFSLLLISILSGVQLKPIINKSLFFFGLMALASAEFSRMTLRYKILPDKLETIHGIIQQNKKNIYFHPLGFVPDIDIKQSRIQRLLGYGSISITMGGEHFVIKDLNRPHKVMKMIENQIEESKHPERKRE